MRHSQYHVLKKRHRIKNLNDKNVWNFLVLSAKLTNVGGFLSKAPDVYVEVTVDGDTKRTTVKKKTTTPNWDEQLVINVTESSVIEFRVVNKAKVFDDSTVGSKSVKISHWLKKESDNGKCK